MIAFVEYCFMVPANRIGSYEFSTAQLKTMQEVITLVVFCVFSVFFLREELKWNYVVGFVLMAILHNVMRLNLVVVTVAAWGFGLVKRPPQLFSLPDFRSVFLKLDILGALKLSLLPAIVAIMFTDLDRKSVV